MKITLIHPPQPNSLDDRLDVPLSLLYIASYTRKNGYEDIKIVDLSSVEESKWKDLLGYADVYGMIVYTASYNICKRIKTVCKEINPECFVVAGGHHVTALPEQSLMDFDAVVKGEGEKAFLEVVKTRERKVYSCNRTVALEEFNFPAWDLIDFNSYHRKVNSKQSMSVITSRGCCYSCRFCCRDVFGSKMRYRDKERVLEEVKYIVDNYTNSFVIYDDIFAINRERLYWLCDRFKELGISFRCNGRVGVNTYEDFKKLAEAGCKELDLGIESGSQKILDLMNKRVTVEQNRQTISDAHRAGLAVKAFLVLGFPGETRGTVEETKNFLKVTGPERYSLFGFIPFPGSDTYRNPDKYGIVRISNNWDEYYCMAGQNESGNPFECSSYTRAELIEWRKEMTEFLADKGYKGEKQDYESRITWREK